jgi:hypothetical protein
MNIYGIEFKGKIRYIGLTKLEPEERYQEHLKGAEKGRKGALLNALRKYGTHATRVVWLASADSLRALKLMEVAAIAAYKTRANRDEGGLNMTDGGDGFVGGIHTEESKAKMRAHGSPWLIGYKHSDDALAKMRDAHKRSWQDSAYRERITIAEKQFWVDHPTARQELSDQKRRAAAIKRGPDLQKKCEWCSDVFFVKNTKAQTRRFCGIPCANQYNWKGKRHSPETKQKIVLARRDQVCTEETRYRMAVSQKARRACERNDPARAKPIIRKRCEQCRRIFDANDIRRRFCGRNCAGRWNPGPPRRHTEETRRRMSVSQGQRRLSERAVGFAVQHTA